MSDGAVPPRLDVIGRLRNEAQLAFAMLAGMQLDVFTPLQDGPATCEELARAIGVGPAKLGPVLYALGVAGLLTVQEGRFSNSEEAAYYLVRGQPGYIGGEHALWSERWSAQLKTAETIRTGVPQARMDWSAMSEDDLLAFFRGGAASVISDGRMLVERYGLARCRSLVDVGGGSGYLAIAVTEACPHLEVTVVDLPAIVPITRRLVEEAGASESVQVLAADVTRAPLEGSFDVAVLKAIIQTMSVDEARATIRHVAAALEPGGEILILGRILDDSRLSPIAAVGMNLAFINIFEGGQSYTEGEHRDWLTEAGFTGIERDQLSAGTDVILARKGDAVTPGR